MSPRRAPRGLAVFGLVFLGVLAACTLGAVSLLTWGQGGLPSTERLRTIEPAIKTSIFDRKGRLIDELYRENRALVSLARIPPHMRDAVLAIEDRRFYSHWGVDPIGVARAVVRNVLSGSVTGGGSTITQQLARNLFLTREQTLQRKLKELILALRIERTYSKDAILEMYLNQIYFGESAYGIQAAAHQFFGKDVDALSLPEAALLAGLPRNPRDYSPRKHPEAALRRRHLVLRAMWKWKKISREEFERADRAPLGVTMGSLNASNAPYFVEMVRTYLEEKYGTSLMYEGGLRVETSLDLDLQQVAERALENHLTRLEELNRMKIRRDALASGRHHDSASTPYLQGAALALDPRTGEILVLVGGRDFDDSNFNRAIQAHRQSGSAFKPFIYLAAIEKGFRPSDVVVDAPLTVHLPEGTVWQPQNYEKDYSGAVTLRHALAHSINIPAVKLLRDVGPETAIRYARRLGIQDRIPPYLSIALGSNDVTLIDLAGAYGVFATSGTLATPLYVLRVLDKNGRRLEENRPSTREVLDAPHAYIVTSMLKSVLNNGTAYAARAAGFTAIAAGKTGTTDDFTDAWFVGFTPDLVAGTWVGFDEKKPIGPRMSGAVAALPVWTEIMIEATRGKPARDFPVPRGVAFVTVCGESGRAASGECPNPVEEVFIDGTEPREPCFLHGPGRDERLRDQWIRRNRAIEGEEIDL